MLSILYMRFSMAMKIFNLHVVSMTFIMLNLFLWPDCYICHWGKTNYCHDYHGNEHHHKNHFLGPYKDLVTPIIKTAETTIPQPKMIAELGSLKKSLSPIFFLNSSNWSCHTISYFSFHSRLWSCWIIVECIVFFWCRR